MMEIYIIEIDDYDYSTRVHNSCFDSYESAKEYLLSYFDHQVTNDKDYFTLKINAHYNSDFRSGDTAIIKSLKLVPSKVNVFGKMIDNLKDESFVEKVINKLERGV